MRQIIILLSLIFICSCAGERVVKKEEPPPTSLPPPPAVKTIPTQKLGKPVLPPRQELKPLFGELLSDVSISKSSFNPSHGDEVAVYFNLSKAARVTVKVYDPDWGLINTISSEENMAPGERTIIWDGKDVDGRVVPDEAYFFTLIAENEYGEKEIYDPTTFSGGKEHDITAADIDPMNHTITYDMPEMGRVMIRTGIQGGPLMRTLVDWKPRVKGMITEYWNGKDEDNLVDIYNHPKFKMIVTYFSFPENSVIAFGNRELSYGGYRRSVGSARAVKPTRESSVRKVSHHYRLPRSEDYSPEIQMTLVNTRGTDDDGATILAGKTLVKVELDKQDKKVFQNQQFEIVFFLDYEFYAEDEAGYTPFNWVWNLSNVEEGEHLFTVNISSFKDQIGVLSRKVRVVKE